jgi:hypothetical protein
MVVLGAAPTAFAAEHSTAAGSPVAESGKPAPKFDSVTHVTDSKPDPVGELAHRAGRMLKKAAPSGADNAFGALGAAPSLGGLPIGG